MAQLVGSEEIESLRIELTEIGRSSLELNSVKDDVDDEDALQWPKIDRVPTFEWLRASLFDESDGSKVDLQGKRVVDGTKLGAREQKMFIEKLIKYNENDNLQLLQKMRNRVDKVGVEFPKLEVRYKNLRVEAMCEVVHGKQVPTLWKSLKSIIFDRAKLLGLKSQEAKLTIMDDVSGVIKPGRMTLLLGPPGCGKTTLLKALSGNLDKSLKVSGEVLYNGHKLEEFIPHKTSTYVNQHDLHMPELTVRETLDFSARCRGVGSQAEIMAEVSKREKEVGVVPDPDVDTFMKAISAKGQRTTFQTDYILKVLGLDVCADVLVGDAMRRGISGGEKKRLTIGEMIIGPTKALFMDEISNGLDSSTTYQVVAYLKQLAHITDATILVALLQPEPETFDLFDDVILMEGGKVVYHGPCKCVLEFFEDCGFRCPERKRVADFLQEVISRKDQEQYWHQVEQSWSYFSVDLFRNKFKESTYGNMVDEDLSKPLVKSESHKNALSFSKYSLSKWELFSACMSREYLLMRRNSFIYVFKAIQLIIAAIIAMTLFLRTRVDVVGANTYMGAIYFALINLFLDGLPEMSMTFARLAVFYKQRNLHFYPAWSYTIPSTILKVPLSLFTALIWTSLTYYVIGYSPEPERFFRQFILLFALHFAAISMFRFVVSLCRTMAASFLAGFVSILAAVLFSGFIIPKSSMPTWLKWGFWVSPMGYGEIGLVVNEFLAPRWQQTEAGNTTLGKETLKNYGLYFRGNFFWPSVGALLGLAMLFNIGFTLALTFLNPPSSRAIISNEKLSQIGGSENSSTGANKEAKSTKSYEKTMAERPKDRLVLPFEPLTLTFQDVQYYVETPSKMRERGFNKKKLQLLCDITGALRPGILTALMGVSGAGKTTLLDVLAGRKTSGVIEGEIRIGGYPKVQDAFARISGYCEQSDVHSPQITVGESVIFSAWLRLHPEIDSQMKFEFVREVLEIIELDEIKDCLVGLPGITGLSTEQRKRLTIAVELVANPSIIFMDEPTTGLDARAAAIVMRAVKNVASTGRTIICTIHQPSIDIFEAFDELLVLKNGGHIIYSGPLGQNSSNVIKYFEDIPGVQKIRNNYNPGTWILEVTSSTVEADLGIDFAQVYKDSLLYQNNKAHVITLSAPPDSKELHFTTRFSQNGWEQFKFCLWKQHLSYWRSPSYNLMRFMFSLIASLFLGILFWDQGRKLNDQQSLFNALGSIYAATIFLGSYNSLSVIPYISTEQLVLYRERFAGMYGSWAYALAQVTVEVPYLLAQAIVFSVITYPMTGYYWSAHKVLWYFYAMFCTLLYFTYLGMLLIAMTPSVTEASILQSFCFRMFNLFSGFLIPQPQIPKWWVWMYYVSPTSWTLNGMLTSQYGDIQEEIRVFGENKTVSAFLSDHLGYHRDHLPIIGVILIIYPVALAFLFAYCIEKLNFQRR